MYLLDIHYYKNKTKLMIDETRYMYFFKEFVSKI